jgi:hypothetical protein
MRKLAKTRRSDQHSRWHLEPMTAWVDTRPGEKIHRDKALVVVACSEAGRLGSLLVLKKSVSAMECK